MLIVVPNDQIRLVTSTTAALDVHVSYVEATSPITSSASTTPGRQVTAISTATTTAVLSAPASGSVRTVKTLMVRNKSTTTANVVTVLHYDGTTERELYKATVGPGGHLQYSEQTGFGIESRVDVTGDAWGGQVIACMRDGNPSYALSQMQLAGNVAPTPTNISTSIARCELFRPAYGMTANRIRFYGVGAVSAVYQVAIYRYSNLARLTSQVSLTTVANTWGSGDITGLSLTAGELYFVACSVNATGTTAGIGAIGGTTAATTGQIQTTPGALPGGLDADSGYITSYRFQFAVTTGALPTTAATLALPAAWTGGMPAFWLDNNSAA